LFWYLRLTPHASLLKTYAAWRYIPQAGESGQGAKNCHPAGKNDYLIFYGLLGILRAMSRIIVLIVGLVWASLLLVSWGTAETPPALGDPAPVAQAIAQSRS
jgi:hypothetical protein